VHAQERIGVQRGVSKGVEDGRRPPALWAGHRSNSCKAVSGAVRPQGVEGLSMAGPCETLRSPWPPLAIRPCRGVLVHAQKRAWMRVRGAGDDSPQEDGAKDFYKKPFWPSSGEMTNREAT
jgi:hypothetical protein